MVNTDGIWDKFVSRLYQIFKKDFIRQKCYYNSQLVIWDNRKLSGEKYEEGFWHLITREERSTGNRLFDPPRAQRLPWCKPTIENGNDPVVKVWEYLESNKRVNTYIWLEAENYLVIIQKRKSVMFLVSAFVIDGEASKRNLKGKYQKRVN